MRQAQERKLLIERMKEDDTQTSGSPDSKDEHSDDITQGDTKDNENTV